MRFCLTLLVLHAATLFASVAGFSILSSFTSSSTMTFASNEASGMSKQQYKKLKEQERKKSQGKNLGKVGITSFQSRSFSDWQASGGKNLFPVDPRSVGNVKEIPYMQRPGGAADDSDLGSKKGGLLNMFGAGRKEPESEPEPKKNTNWWTL